MNFHLNINIHVYTNERTHLGCPSDDIERNRKFRLLPQGFDFISDLGHAPDLDSDSDPYTGSDSHAAQ